MMTVGRKVCTSSSQKSALRRPDEYIRGLQRPQTQIRERGVALGKHVAFARGLNNGLECTLCVPGFLSLSQRRAILPAIEAIRELARSQIRLMASANFPELSVA